MSEHQYDRRNNRSADRELDAGEHYEVVTDFTKIGHPRRVRHRTVTTMSTYAVNDRQIIVIWSDGEKRRWESVTAVKELAGVDVVASALESVSHTLWQRCEFLGERERLAAIIRSALRRNGSEFPNRRRAKVEPTAWDRRTQVELTEVVRRLGTATAGMPDSVRSGVRFEVMRELDAVYTWANGGRDRNGRVGQMQLPTTHRIDMVSLGRALTELTQQGGAGQRLNDVTQALLSLLLAAAAVSERRQTPQGRGLTAVDDDWHDAAQVVDIARLRDARDMAVELVLADNDAAEVLRACVGDMAAKSCGLVGAWPYYSFSGYRSETSDPNAYRAFAQRCEHLIGGFRTSVTSAPAGVHIGAGNGFGQNGREEISRERLMGLAPRAMALASNIGSKNTAAVE